MEDQRSKWKIQEPSSSEEDDEGVSRVKWVLTNGYGIGRKLIITPIVISSSMLVLPQHVYSAKGCAFSLFRAAFLQAMFASISSRTCYCLICKKSVLTHTYFCHCDPNQITNLEWTHHKLTSFCLGAPYPARFTRYSISLWTNNLILNHNIAP
ncbi:hypothetical protein HanHA300_Chr09g0301341 [Helianthus annuus]|nr:hypothetical protein HanHA300_Chr09g0301341 [Helianthus annuus]KAJ0540749.1 hypothetical protein HanHA89_Chr09g0320421 [Helianthus annuus]KAJ0705856.1 hypothetical protein HanLR1_Chr09g0300221 [Helianthus annuus]KAJ0709987.1 hypothetical protein HanOQP8_Chr09g0306991 [Helianthus annuus]